MQSIPDIPPLIVHRNIDDGDKSKYCIMGNFCSQNFIGVIPGTITPGGDIPGGNIPAGAMPGFYLQLVKYDGLENRGSGPAITDFFQRVQL